MKLKLIRKSSNALTKKKCTFTATLTLTKPAFYKSNYNFAMIKTTASHLKRYKRL